MNSRKDTKYEYLPADFAFRVTLLERPTDSASKLDISELQSHYDTCDNTGK